MSKLDSLYHLFSFVLTGELYSRVAQGGLTREIRILNTAGIAGAVFQNGAGEIVHDAYADDRFDSSVDEQTGFTTKNIVCAPVRTVRNDIIGVIQKGMESPPKPKGSLGRWVVEGATRPRAPGPSLDEPDLRARNQQLTQIQTTAWSISFLIQRPSINLNPESEIGSMLTP